MKRMSSGKAMCRKVLLAVGVMVGTVVAVAGNAATTPPATPKQLACVNAVLKAAEYYTDVQHKIIRLSIRSNLQQQPSFSMTGFLCSGGSNHGQFCDFMLGNAGCPSGECQTGMSAGTAADLDRARVLVRKRIKAACDPADLAILYPALSISRCGQGDVGASATGLAEHLSRCILTGALDPAATSFDIPIDGTMGRVAPAYLPDLAPLAQIGGLSLGARLQVGSLDRGTVIEGGRLVLSQMTGCAGTLCSTAGIGVVGNMTGPPRQTWAGLVPFCQVDRMADAGGGLSETGQIDFGNGAQTSSEPRDVTVFAGTACPLCTSARTCDSGLNTGMRCSNPGATDIACPPSVGIVPVFHLAVNLTTGTQALAVPVSGPGVVNPLGAFCGSCDIGSEFPCQSDGDCTAQASCGGPGCCQFSTHSGAFGVSNATIVFAEGKAGPYLPRLATVACVGETGDVLVDDVLGLPGPMRYVETRLNSFVW